MRVYCNFTSIIAVVFGIVIFSTKFTNVFNMFSHSYKSIKKLHCIGAVVLKLFKNFDFTATNNFFLSLTVFYF